MSSAGNPNTQGFPQNDAPVVDPSRNYQWSTYWLRFMMNLWQRTGAAQGGVTPRGQVALFGSITPPGGWLLCDGSAIDRIVYSALFSIIGTTFGIGDGTTTFNIPDLRGKFVIGAGMIPVGTTGGSSSVTLSTTELPAHTHTITDPGHNHSTLATTSNVTTGTDPGGVTTGGTTGTSTTGITVNSTGTGSAFSILPPYAAVVYIIKT
jgi:microcystin-dependent protein